MIWLYKYTSAHTLARSLNDVFCANNNREAVVVCFRLALYASGMRFFLEIFEFKKYVDGIVESHSPP